MITKEQALALQRQAAEAIQEYSQSQVDIWQQIPYWAVIANGRVGWMDSWSTIAHRGFLRLESSRGLHKRESPTYAAAVDLGTGIIFELRHGAELNPPTPAHPRLACLLDIDDLDAQRSLDWLKKKSEEAIPGYMGIDGIKNYHHAVAEALARYGYAADKPYVRTSPQKLAIEFYPG